MSSAKLSGLQARNRKQIATISMLGLCVVSCQLAGGQKHLNEVLAAINAQV